MVEINRGIRLQKISDERFYNGTDPATLRDEIDLRAAILQKETRFPDNECRLIALNHIENALSHEEQMLHGWSPVMSTLREYINYETEIIRGLAPVDAAITAAQDEAKRLTRQLDLEEHTEKDIVKGLLENKAQLLQEYKETLDTQGLQTVEMY